MFIVSLLVEKISELIVNLGWEKTTKVVKEHIGKKNNIYIYLLSLLVKKALILI